MNVYLVCFDISDNKNRDRAGKELLAYGERVQKSVFEITLRHPDDLESIREALRPLLEGFDRHPGRAACQVTGSGGGGVEWLRLKVMRECKACLARVRAGKASLAPLRVQMPPSSPPISIVPPFAKGGLGGISIGWLNSKLLINPPRSPFCKGGRIAHPRLYRKVIGDEPLLAIEQQGVY